MARFDVYTFSRGAVPFVIDVQADLLSDLKTRVVIPLVLEAKAKKEILPRLKPVLQVQGKNYILMTTDIGTIRTNDLGDVIVNLKNYRQEITEAVDFLFQGF